MRRFILTIVILTLALFLVGCERPLQDDDGATAPLTEPTLEIPGGTLAPLATPTVGAGYPGPDAESEDAYPAPGEGEAPATDGETSTEPTPPTPAEEAEQSDEDIVHVVGAGDTLGAIAVRYGVTVEEIAAANNLSNVHTLDVGQELIIPVGGVDTPPETSETPDESAAPEEQVYIVQSGDTLYRIGLRYGFTVEALVAYNEIANPEDLDVGQQILIPPEGYTAP